MASTAERTGKPKQEISRTPTPGANKPAGAAAMKVPAPRAPVEGKKKEVKEKGFRVCK